MAKRFPISLPPAVTAVILTAIPFIISLAMLGFKYRIGPYHLFQQISIGGGFVLFGCMIAGSGFILVAWSNAQGQRDWRIPLSLILLLLALINVFIFRM